MLYYVTALLFWIMCDNAEVIGLLTFSLKTKNLGLEIRIRTLSFDDEHYKSSSHLYVSTFYWKNATEIPYVRKFRFDASYCISIHKLKITS